MRYVIIGAGAVGGTVGGLLTEVGREVVLVARGAHLTAIREDGLRLGTPAGIRTVPCVTASGPGEVELRPDDVLVFAVKSQDTASALAAWADRPVAGGRTAAQDLLVVLAQNGVDNERTALRRFRRVAGLCVWLPATFLRPGEVSAAGSPVTGVLTQGSVPVSETPDPQLTEVAADLTAAGFRAPVVNDVMAWKYAKLLSNLANAVEALCGPARDNVRATWETLADAAVEEGRTVLTAANIQWATAQEESAVRGDFRLAEVPGAPRGGGSTWQSLQRNMGVVEARWLNGEIVLLGRLAGVPTPVNELLTRRVEQVAAAGDGAGHNDPASLLSEARELGHPEARIPLPSTQ